MSDLVKVIIRKILDDKTLATNTQIISYSNETIYKINLYDKQHDLDLSFRLIADRCELSLYYDEHDNGYVRFRIEIKELQVEGFEAEIDEMKAYCLKLVNQ
jgi:hypothetical protein